MARIRTIIIIIGIAIALKVSAQINVCGVVVEQWTDEPLAGASVILRDAGGKIKKYGATDANGEFVFSMPTIKGFTIDVSMMSFAKQTLALDSVRLPLTIVMEPSTTKLKEVAVKSDRIRGEGDTVTYNVGAFAQAQDRSIGDVLRRMPGIDVSEGGKIQYQGEDINKFYIEGSDLLGGKYGIATNGIDRDDVGAVEVMENHQPLQVLSGISFSDKAAINLKLKNKAKATWSFHGDAAGGLWDGDLFAMAAMPRFQNITTFKANNTGEDLSANSTDFFAESRGTGLSRYVGVSLPEVPSLNQKRTLFNRSALISTNNLWKLKGGELKAQIDYSFNRVTAQASNITTYFLESGDRVVAENRDGRSHSHSLSGKFIYEVNKKTAFINNTFQADIDWDDARLAITGSMPNYQSVSLPDYYVGNKLKIIKRFNGKHLVTFQSNNEWESLPQTLKVAMNSGNPRQDIGDHALYTHESASYAFSLKGVTVSLEGGVKGYIRSLDTQLQEMPKAISEETENVLNTNYLTFYVTPKFEYWVKRMNFTLDMPMSFASYTFDKAIANRSEIYLSPSLNINWKPNNRLSMGLRGGTGRSPMNLNMIQPGYIMTDYRSFRQGVDNFYNSTSQRVSANFSFKHTRKGVFANAYALHSWTHLPYTIVQQLYGDYAVYSYTDAKNDGRMLITGANIGKTLDFMRGSANVNCSFSRNESYIISENRRVSNVGTSWSVGGKINGAPLGWLSFDYSVDFSNTQLCMNGECDSWLGSFENYLLINIMPHSKWEWRVAAEHYRNELTAGTYKSVFMFDTKIVFKMSKRVELSATLNNILNERTYSYITYNQLSSYESQRWLRGRELLISISLRK